jgi:hypothetical protein
MIFAHVGYIQDLAERKAWEGMGQTTDLRKENSPGGPITRGILQVIQSDHAALVHLSGRVKRVCLQVCHGFC